MSIPGKVREAVMDRCGGLCEVGRAGCESVATEIHHIKSRSRGGSDDIKNLLAVCKPCHQAITEKRPGTRKHRSWSWQEEGETEADLEETWPG